MFSLSRRPHDHDHDHDYDHGHYHDTTRTYTYITYMPLCFNCPAYFYPLQRIRDVLIYLVLCFELQIDLSLLSSAFLSGVMRGGVWMCAPVISAFGCVSRSSEAQW
ncbi:hypothetical protein F4809DRAFT_335660 [Biscogniauxia mediterranea]|nr:hypothetical protein F4809DRAFT_335660 [Biscogniauxia mediterranea]